MSTTRLITNTTLTIRQRVHFEPDEQFEVTLKNQAKGQYPAKVIGIERTFSLPTDPSEALRESGPPLALIEPQEPSTHSHGVFQQGMEEEDWSKVESMVVNHPLPTGVTLDFTYDVR